MPSLYDGMMARTAKLSRARHTNRPAKLWLPQRAGHLRIAHVVAPSFLRDLAIKRNTRRFIDKHWQQRPDLGGTIRASNADRRELHSPIRRIEQRLHQQRVRVLCNLEASIDGRNIHPVAGFAAWIIRSRLGAQEDPSAGSRLSILQQAPCDARAAVLNMWPGRASSQRRKPRDKNCASNDFLHWMIP
ncbi:hypothetical protein [Duganella sp. Dugasp56]|uniref:hypothetical protein n=1 Tax=Duganella sp. Dugasp56 TaxID=3243046 RepID=UPI0039AEBA96